MEIWLQITRKLISAGLKSYWKNTRCFLYISYFIWSLERTLLECTKDRDVSQNVMVRRPKLSTLRQGGDIWYWLLDVKGLGLHDSWILPLCINYMVTTPGSIMYKGLKRLISIYTLQQQRFWYRLVSKNFEKISEREC